MIQKNQHNPSTALMLAVSTGIKCLRDKKIVYASLYSSVLNNRPVTFFTKFALLIRTRFSTYPLPISLIGPVALLSTAWIFFLPEGLLRLILCLGKPGLLKGPTTSLTFCLDDY